MYPTTTITVNKDGSSLIEGQEQSNQCYKLSQLGVAAGRVEKDKKKEHPPVKQKIQVKGQ